MALWRVLDITSGALRAPSSTRHKRKNPIKKEDKNAAGTAFAAKPLGDSPFPLRRRNFLTLCFFSIGLFFILQGFCP